MKLGVVPEHPLEQIALWSGLLPGPLVIGVWGMGYSQVLIAACRLGVFETLAEGERSAEQVAEALECDPMGTETLLNALNGFGLLRHRNGRYGNTARTTKVFTRQSPDSMLDAAWFCGDLWDQLGGLEGALRSGRMRRFHEDQMPDGFWERYMRGLACMAKPAGKEVARKVELPSGARRLLDVGGGHGLFSVALCRKHPDLVAEVLDLPQAAAIGREIVAEAGFADRVTYREGDLRTTDWGVGLDAIVVFNVLHNSSTDEAVEICRKAFAALNPGGKLVIMDSEHRPRAGNHSFMGGYNELFFFLVSGTRAYPEQTMRSWVEQAGFTGIRSRRMMFLPEVLITGTRPQAS